MQLTCFISYLKSTKVLVAWNHQQINNEWWPQQTKPWELG